MTVARGPLHGRMALALALFTACGRLNFAPLTDGDGGGNGDGGNGNGDGGTAINDGSLPIVGNVMFMTSTRMPITAFNNLAGADTICNAAASGRYQGNFVAWLSTSAVNAATRLAGSRGWVRPDGRPFADTIAELTGGQVFYPPILDETGSVPAVVSTWTGTAGNGTVTPGETCGDWGSTSGTTVLGSPSEAGDRWTRVVGVTTPCTDVASLYCFGTGASNDVGPPPPGAGDRRAFITDGMWASGGGRSSADALCQAEGAIMGGSWLALMATSTQSALGRFNRNGPVWKRLDGVALAGTVDQMAQGFDVGLDLSPSGAWHNDPTATGVATDLDSVGVNTCQGDWTSGTGGRNYTIGAGNLTGPLAFSFINQTCNVPARLFCFEQ